MEVTYEELVQKSQENYEKIEMVLKKELKEVHLYPEDLEYMDTFGKCINCGLCISVCPVIEEVGINGFLGPREIDVSMVRNVHHVTDQVDVIFKCIGCNACHEICPRKIPTKEIVMFLRHKLLMLDKSKVPTPLHSVMNNFDQYKMFYEPKPIEKRQKIIQRQLKKVGLPYIPDPEKEHADVLFYTGCKAENRLYLMREAAKLILTKLNVDFTMLKDMVCCGYASEEMGDYERRDKLRSELVQKIKKVSPKYIVTICPGCTASLKRIVEKYGLDINVKHMVEYLIDDIGLKNLTVNSNQELVVTMQYPCNLYREFGDYIKDYFKQILENVGNATVKEASISSKCCGGGAYVPLIYPKISNKMLKTRVDAMKEENVKVITTICPECNLSWNTGLHLFDKEKTLELLDLFVFLAALLYSR